VTKAARGSLRPASGAPAVGERSEELVRRGGFVVEQILSGALDAPMDYDQDHDEWVLLLSGGASLEVGDETLDLVAGDWLLLAAHVRHRLVRTVPGTSWLAVHATR
jgi:cupin 2 domain-containing protein